VSEPLTLFVELATLLGEDDLVAVGDALVLDPAELDPRDLRPWITLDALRAGCEAARAHGVRRARRAAARVRQGAESPMETFLRLLILRAGLPEPELNQELFDDRGRWIGRFDMVYRDARVIVEYDGDQHRTSTVQYERDISRIDRAIAASWTVVRVRASGIYIHPHETVRRVQEALSG
jgi:very-short-patch-repair endonuclease